MTTEKKETLKERARRLRKEAYRKAKDQKKKRDQEIKDKVARGEIEAPPEWLALEQRKQLARDRAREQRRQKYAREKSRRRQEKECQKKEQPKLDLSDQIMRASHLHELRTQAERGTHLKLIK